MEQNIASYGLIISAVTGLILGSFFNCVIYRLPRSKSLLWPQSHCTHCNKPIPFYENIPVFSYLFLKGKCSGCKSSISIQYPLIEAITCSLAIVLWYFQIKPLLLHPLTIWEYIFVGFKVLLLLVLIPISVIDIHHYIIPDSLSIGGLVTGLFLSFLPGGITPLSSLIGCLTGGLILICIGLAGEYLFKKKDAMGGGDIKLMACIGAFWGYKIAIMGIILGSLLGSIAGIGLMAVKKLNVDHRIPFGPFLAAGVWAAVLCGEALLGWYLNFFILK